MRTVNTRRPSTRIFVKSVCYLGRSFGILSGVARVPTKTIAKRICASNAKTTVQHSLMYEYYLEFGVDADNI